MGGRGLGEMIAVSEEQALRWEQDNEDSKNHEAGRVPLHKTSCLNLVCSENLDVGPRLWRMLPSACGRRNRPFSWRLINSSVPSRLYVFSQMR
jgi:hypothetical protein